METSAVFGASQTFGSGIRLGAWCGAPRKLDNLTSVKRRYINLQGFCLGDGNKIIVELVRDGNLNSCSGFARLQGNEALFEVNIFPSERTDVSLT